MSNASETEKGPGLDIWVVERHKLEQRIDDVPL
jgi:hypothetical protein